MRNKLIKQQLCILMRPGVELWIDKDKAQRLQDYLESISEHKFINFGGRTINTADVTGIFTSRDMEDLIRHKRGQWRCKNDVWHDRNEKCECRLERINDDGSVSYFVPGQGWM